MEQLRTKQQNTQLFGLLAHLCWTHYREDLALQYSNNRTKKTSELTISECNALIQKLQEEAATRVPETKKKMLSKFFSICHRLGWETESGKLDYTRIENWLKKYSIEKKGINDYPTLGLPKLITQIEKLLPNGKEKD